VVLKRDNDREKKKRKTPAKKSIVAGTSTLPKLKIKPKQKAKKSLGWKPSRVSAKLVDEDDSDVSWTGISYIKRLNKSLLILCRKN
jgi:hypothetical protein